jgi:hypothetical protein
MLVVMGAMFRIPWKTLEPGMSFFIPCLEEAPHKLILEAQAKRLGKRVVSKRVVENGKYGLRTWVVE